MARPFNKLRGLMQEYEIQQKHLARELNMGITSVSRRMSGSEEWRLDEIWKVMELLHIPACKMHEYFPAQGINEPGVSRPKIVRA